MKKWFGVILISLFLPFQVVAAESNIECTNDQCFKNGADPLFSDSVDGFWYPNRVLTKEVDLKNATSLNKQTAVKGVRKEGNDFLNEMMSLSLTGADNSLIWSGSLSDFYLQEKIILGDWHAQQDKVIHFTLAMNQEADNQYQGRKSIFDLILGFWQVDQAETTAASTLLACADQKPIGVPILSLIRVENNQVNLSWTAISGPLTYYLLAYRTDDGREYGNPNIGGNLTLSYLVGGLSGGESYYFRIRAGNGCMPGDFSNEIAVTVPGSILTTLPVGFQEGVLGEKITESVGPIEESQIAGESNQKLERKYWWLWFLVVLLAYVGKRIFQAFFHSSGNQQSSS